MTTVLGFVTRRQQISNVAGVVSDFFELSPISLSYSRNRGEYYSDDYPGDVLHVFTAKNAAGEYTVLLETEISTSMKVIEEVFKYCASVVGELTSQDLVRQITTVMAGKLTAFTHGSIYSGGRYRMPEWVAWKMPDGGEFRIWLRNTAFENQYPVSEIVVVPISAPIDTLFSDFASLSTTAKAVTVSQITDTLQAAKLSLPETYSRVLTFKLYNQNNLEQSIDTHWGFLIYGKNGDNIDAMKDALQAKLLASGTHTDAEWMKLLPEVFKRTEFLVFPRWDKKAITNITELASIYSSVFSTSEMEAFVLRNLPVAMPDTYVHEKLRVIPFDYKAITAAILAGETNGGSQDTIEEVFPDYIPIDTNSPDFNRMSVKTQSWVLKMIEMIIIAETATEYSTVLNPFRRVKRNNKLFLSYLYENINYLVSVRSNNLA